VLPLTVYSLYDFNGTIKRTIKLYAPIADIKENPEDSKVLWAKEWYSSFFDSQ
jgi:hypothetical protein